MFHFQSGRDYQDEVVAVKVKLMEEEKHQKFLSLACSWMSRVIRYINQPKKDAVVEMTFTDF